MRVVRLPSSSNPHLRDGAEYLVLGIQRLPSAPVSLLLLDEDGQPMAVDASEVITADDSIPASWSAIVDADGNIAIQPRSWQTPGFWHAYWNEWHPATADWGARRAKDLFDREVEAMESDGFADRR